MKAFSYHDIENHSSDNNIGNNINLGYKIFIDIPTMSR